MATIPSNPISLKNFLQTVVRSPSYSAGDSTGLVSYSSTDEVGVRHFYIRVGPRVAIRGKVFRDQDTINEYLSRRGIMVNPTHVDFEALAILYRHSSVLLMEEIKVISQGAPLSMGVMARTKILLGTTGESTSILASKLGSFTHRRTGDPIPMDTWVPLFRPGNILPDKDGNLIMGVDNYVIF